MRGHGWRSRPRSVLCVLLVGALALVAPAAAEASIGVDDVQVTEGDGGVTATFTLTRSVPLLALAATSVAFETVDATASAPADYLAASGSRTFPGSLLGGTQTQRVAVTIAGDRLDEPEERFRLLLAGAEVTDGEGIGTIADDDPQPAVAVGDAAPATEGGTASFGVSLSAPSGRDVSVAFATANGSATAGQDYTARSGRLTIPAGGTAATVPVALLGDTADEPAESFELRLSAPGAATLGRGVASATIVDDDEPPAQASAPVGAGQQPAKAPEPRPAGSSAPSSSRPPRLGLGSPRLRRPGTALITISCPPEAGRCSGRVTLFSRPSKRSKIKALRSERRLGRRTFALDGGRTQTLELLLGRRDRGLLERAGRMHVRAVAVTRDGGGPAGVRTVNGTLLRRTSHSSPSRRR